MKKQYDTYVCKYDFIYYEVKAIFLDIYLICSNDVFYIFH